MINELNRNDADAEEIQKSFLKMKSNMGKDGYREGIEQGKQKVFQKYFDGGYFDGFRNGYTLGKLKGTLWGKSTFNDSSRPNIETLEQSTNAACIMCNQESFLTKSISDISTSQTKVLSNLITSMELNQ